MEHDVADVALLGAEIVDRAEVGLRRRDAAGERLPDLAAQIFVAEVVDELVLGHVLRADVLAEVAAVERAVGTVEAGVFGDLPAEHRI